MRNSSLTSAQLVLSLSARIVLQAFTAWCALENYGLRHYGLALFWSALAIMATLSLHMRLHAWKGPCFPVRQRHGA